MLTLAESAEGRAIKSSLMVGAFNCCGHLGSFRLHLTLYMQKPFESNRLRVSLQNVLATTSSAGPVQSLVVNEPFDQNTTKQCLVVGSASVIVTVHCSSCTVLL